MKTFLKAAALGLLVTGQAGAAQLNDIYSSFFVLGDSLSDVGNLGPLSPPFPYFQNPQTGAGQFSNGPVWADILDDGFSDTTSRNYAYGGARATFPSVTPNPNQSIDLPAQLIQFAADLDPNIPDFIDQRPGTPVLGDRPLVALWYGGNDVIGAVANLATQLGTIALTPGLSDLEREVQSQLALFGAQGVIIKAAADIGTALSSLSSDVALNDFLVFNLPDIGATPLFNKTPVAPIASGLSQFFNVLLDEEIAKYAVPGENFTRIDVFAELQRIAGATNPLGLTNVADNCLAQGPACTPESFLFWDDVHPTGAVHAELARIATIAAIPLPASLPLMLGGLLLVGAVARRRAA